ASAARGTVARMDSDEADVEPSFLWTGGANILASAPPPPKRRKGLITAGLIVVVGLIAGGLFVITRDKGGDAPSKWDPRILSLVHYVERDRALTFKHPVKSEFLSVAAFKRKVTGHQTLTNKEKDEIRHYEGLFRALGLVQGNIDLVKEEEKLTGETVLGEYEP